MTNGTSVALHSYELAYEMDYEMDFTRMRFGYE